MTGGGTNGISLKVALVDDHQLFREGLRAVLANQPDLTVVGEASDAREAYTVVDTTQPDVVVLDVALPGVNGIAAARELTRREPRRKILVLSMHVGEDYVARALSAGATGYALKEQSAGELVEAIRAVARGQAYLSPRISRFVVEDYLRLRRGEGGTAGPLGALSAREKEVFDLLVRGFSNDGIAGQLCISVKTVETHRAHILRKLRVHSIAELIRFAARHGLVCD
jgi:DNA-binding NarL/FixJ family response regulator